MGDLDPFMRNDAAARTKAHNRANVLQLKLIGQTHSTGLTNSLLRLFQARPPMEYRPPIEKRKCPPLTGMAQFVSNFAEKGDSEYHPPVQKVETSLEKKARIQKLRVEQGANKAAQELEKYDPRNDPNTAGDGYKTLFVAKLNYETSESKIKREFEAYGPIKRVRLVTDLKTNKPRGYAFVEFVHTRDMKAAYKQGDGKKIDNRRVLVDVERGRTVPNWRPRRLGGGLGTTRVREEDSHKPAERVVQRSGEQTLSEEPRTRDEQHEDRKREKSRERGRDKEKEREKSLEQSLDRPRDRGRDLRDRDRNKEKDRDIDRGGRDRERRHDRDHGRDRGREKGRDRDRGLERPIEESEYNNVDLELDHGRSCVKDYDHVTRDKNYENEYSEQGRGDHDRYDHRDHVNDDQMDE